MNVVHPTEQIQGVVPVSLETTSSLLQSDQRQESKDNYNTMSQAETQYICDPTLTWRGENRRRLKHPKTANKDEDINVASVSSCFGEMRCTDNINSSTCEGVDKVVDNIQIVNSSNLTSSDENQGVLTTEINVDEENATFLKAKRFFKLSDAITEQLSSGMRKKYKLKYKKWVGRHGDLDGKTVDDYLTKHT